MTDTITQTYRVTFDRIGRSHDVVPLTAVVTASRDDQADALAEEVYRHARRYLMSRDVMVQTDLDQNAVTIFCGFHVGGTGTIEVVDRASAES